jgi:hypothetical protein
MNAEFEKIDEGCFRVDMCAQVQSLLVSYASRCECVSSRGDDKATKLEKIRSHVKEPRLVHCTSSSGSSSSNSSNSSMSSLMSWCARFFGISRHSKNLRVDSSAGKKSGLYKLHRRTPSMIHQGISETLTSLYNPRWGMSSHYIPL